MPQPPPARRSTPPAVASACPAPPYRVVDRGLLVIEKAVSYFMWVCYFLSTVGYLATLAAGIATPESTTQWLLLTLLVTQLEARR